MGTGALRSLACMLGLLSRTRPQLESREIWRNHKTIIPYVVVYSLSRVRPLWPPRTVVFQAPLSVRFSRQEYWGGLPFPSLGDLPNPEIKSLCPASPVLAGRFFTASASWEAPGHYDQDQIPNLQMAWVKPAWSYGILKVGKGWNDGLAQKIMMSAGS